MSQLVDGYAWMRRNIQKFFRASANPGMVDDDVIADAITMGERWAHDEIIASHVHWNVKYTEVDDVGLSLGTEIDYLLRQLLIVEDLGITDLARVASIWRTSAAREQPRIRVPHVETEQSSDFIRSPGSLVGPSGEVWTEGGALNSNSSYEQTIQIYNWNTSLPGGLLGIEYHWYPPIVEVDWFSEVDANGDLTRGPQMPRVMWPWILEYAKWCVAEVTDDIAKQRALARRFKSRGGIQERAREYLGQFQTGGPDHVVDTFRNEG